MTRFYSLERFRKYKRQRNRRVRAQRDRTNERIGQIEPLETRIALAADVFATQNLGAIDGGWQVIVLDANGDDLYIRHTLETDGNPDVVNVLQYDTDVNFVSPQTLDESPTDFRDILVTNGIRNQQVGGNFFAGTNGFATIELETAAEAVITPVGTTSSENAVALGTLEGSVAIPDANGFDQFIFRPQFLNPRNPQVEPGRLVFSDDGGQSWSETLDFTHTIPDPANPPPAVIDETVTVSGRYNYQTGDVFLDFDAGNSIAWFNPAGNVISVAYAAPIIPDSPSHVQIAPGLDLNNGLYVDLPSEGSSVRISSPLVNAGTTNEIALGATNVFVDAAVTSDAGFYVLGTTANGDPAALVQDGIAGSWWGGGAGDTEVENIVFTAPVTAPEVGIIVVDDQDDTAASRGRLYVSSSGSINATNELSVEAFSSDIIYEGDVSSAGVQSYRWITREDSTPLRFVTTSSSGASAGTISAATLDVLVSNEQVLNPSNSVEHVIDLDTAVGSMRLSAAQGLGQDSGTPPYQYAVSIREQDALSLDTSLASGGPVSIQAGGALSVNATLQSVGDLALSSTGGAVTGNAWLTTSAGSIDVSGTSVDLGGRMQVLAAPVDESLTDIQVVATNGNIALGGGALAVNRIRLEQSGTGTVSSGAIVASEYLDVFSQGAVDLRTDSGYVNIDAEADVSVVESDDAEFVIDTIGLASVVVEGIDPNDSTGRAALKAQLRGTNNILLSAPRGSIDVTALTAADLVIGDAAGLLAGTASSMQAAGNVSVRSTQGDLFVLDAPLAGDGAMVARVASADNASGGNLNAIYVQNVPGVTPATLTALNNGSLNLNPNFAAVFPGDSLRNDAGDGLLRVRDIVLLRGQTNQEENGLYQIAQLGSTTTPFVLRRVALADTTAEFATNAYIAITDGDFQGTSFQVGAYANVLNTTPLEVTVGNDRSAEEVTVRLATEQMLAGTFNGAGQITADANGALSINGLGVNLNDIVLVQDGVTLEAGASSIANGIYEVVQVGDAANPWILTRFNDPSTLTPVAEATVVVTEGFYRTALTGETLTVSYNGLGVVALPIAQVALTTEIGSYDPSDISTFVVSTNGDTNTAAGSLGKMLSLIQDNSAVDLSLEVVEQTVRFANELGSVTGPTGTIVLRQELPVINKAFEIDTATRYALSASADQSIVIDGSRITSTRENTFVTQQTVEEGGVNGFEYQSGASTVLTPTPEEATQSRISGLQIAGFEKGGAVVIDGASNLLVEGLTIGLDENDASQAVKYGIHVTGASGATGPVTLLDNNIFSASVFSDGASPLEGAGVLIDGTSQGVQVVGGAVGGAQQSNTSGVIVESSNDNTTRANSIGVNVLPAVTVTTTTNRSTITIAQADWDVIGEDLYLGQAVAGTGITSGSEIIHINPATRQIVLSERMILSGQSSITFDQGQPTRTTVSNNFFGVEMRSGHVRMTNTTVSDNVLDGVVVGTAIPDPIWARIGAGIALNTSGAVDPTVRSSSSNSIYSNGRYGIRFASGINSNTQSTSLAPPANITTVISVQGNYIGTDVNLTDGLQNSRADYQWDNIDPITGLAYGDTPPPGSGFESLVTSANPAGENPAEDDGNGNISADLGPPSSGTPPVDDDGAVRLPPRR